MAWYRCGTGGGGQPAEKIPFVASSGAQYLSLPVYTDEDIIIKAKILIPSAPTAEVSFINSEWSVNGFGFHGGYGYLQLRYNTSSDPRFNNKDWKWVNVEYNTTDGTLLYDGTTYGGTHQAYAHKAVQIFGVDNGHFSAMAISEMKVFKDGALYMNLEPRKDASTGAGYLYDTIGEQSYYSLTSTPLIYEEYGVGGVSITYKNYIKFNGTGIILPWTVNSDYKVECVFHEAVYHNNTCITGTTGGYNNAPYIAAYNNSFDAGTGTGYQTLASWTSGEHTYINNNANDQNELDGTTGNYTPITNSFQYTIGCRGSITAMGYQGYIKSFKIYSKTTGTLLHDLKPCTILNLAAFHDIIEDKLYTNGDLEAVDSIS